MKSNYITVTAPAPLAVELVGISADILPTPLTVPSGFVKSALDARNFVQSRQTEGGVAAEPTAALLADLAQSIEADVYWQEVSQQNLQDADQTLRHLAKQMV